MAYDRFHHAPIKGIMSYYLKNDSNYIPVSVRLYTCI